MSTSQTGLELRQRGLAIVAGGLILQLVGLVAIVQTPPAAIAFVPLVIAVLATARTYIQIKDHTGIANTASVATVVIAFIVALIISSPMLGLLVLIGAAIVYIGNKQLAAGVRS